IGIAALAICFVLSIATNIQWFDHVDNGGGEHAAADADHAADADEHGDDPVVAADEHADEAVADEHAEEAEPGGHGEAAEEHHSVEPIHKTWTWWSSGDVEFTAGMLLDGPAVMMLFVVTLISLLVHVYSTDYVGGDRRYTH